MSKITEIIFKGEKHYITSKFGYRKPISTKAGDSGTKHRGTDYGTHQKKLPQYAIEDGVIYDVGTAKDGAKYVKVDYPRINKRFHHWHLHTISVKEGQAVKKYTKLGTTGETGKATGVHLHLGIIDLKNDTYIDPEKYAKEYKEPKVETKPITTSTKYYKKYTGKSGSIVDALKSIQEDSSFSYRKKIAKANNIKVYVGLPSQNIKMLNLLKQGKLIKA